MINRHEQIVRELYETEALIQYCESKIWMYPKEAGKDLKKLQRKRERLYRELENMKNPRSIWFRPHY